jgi:hypothetical protein
MHGIVLDIPHSISWQGIFVRNLLRVLGYSYGAQPFLSNLSSTGGILLDLEVSTPRLLQ